MAMTKTQCWEKVDIMIILQWYWISLIMAAWMAANINDMKAADIMIGVLAGSRSHLKRNVE